MEAETSAVTNSWKPRPQGSQNGISAEAGSLGAAHAGADVSKLRCIELGSGCGLLPIHAARLGMACVVATDQPAMVRLARHNIKVNHGIFFAGYIENAALHELVVNPYFVLTSWYNYCLFCHNKGYL